MSFRPTVLIYEFFTGGGCPAGELPRGLASEALGMLWALLADFQNWQAARTITALDPRFESRVSGLNRKTLPADEVVCSPAGEHFEIYSSLLKSCDAALVVAPETGGLLAGLTAQAESAGIPLLCSSASAVETAGDKAVCSRLLRLSDLPTPFTRIAGFDNAPRIAERMGFPLVVKPLDGVGSEGVFRLGSVADLPAALLEIRRITSREKILLQTFENGIDASVSLLVMDERSLPVSLNRQLIAGGPRIQYQGSEIPFHHKLEKEAMASACAAAGLIPGLRGYVGVDLILAESGPQLIEINPRVTTSYVGLRQIARTNLARTIWEACMTGALPECIPLDGRVVIRTDEPGSWGCVERKQLTTPTAPCL